VPIVLMSDSAAHDFPRVWWKEAIKRRIIRSCEVGLVGGRPHKDYLAELGMPLNRIFVGYDVVDNDFFWQGANAARMNAASLRQSLGLPAQFFLASSRFIAKKNLVRLLEAFALYRRASVQGTAWKLVLLGDGELRKELEPLRDRLGLCEEVLMPGFKQYHELPTYYGLAGAFVHASTSEQWGLVVNEAMAAGLPVLVSRNCGCAADLVRDGVNGFGFDPLDVSALAELFARIAKQPECDLQAMGEASREIIARWGPAAFEKNLMMAVGLGLKTRRQKPTCLDRLLLNGLIHFGERA
jgi:glycosyltransferase involved in cell wall biosynthesis